MARSEITEMLVQADQLDRQLFDRLFTLVYKDFRALANRYLASEKAQTLQPTALVNEAYLKLVDQTRVNWKNRSHFFAVGALAMRRILVNRAVASGRQKRDGRLIKVELDENLIAADCAEDVLAVDQALRDLERANPRHARIVELRFFAGLTVPEIAEALGVSASTIEKDWRFCSAWLKHALSSSDEE
jgi:RNA polymerase sigma-70 factor (ECF subfamily)